MPLRKNGNKNGKVAKKAKTASTNNKTTQPEKECEVNPLRSTIYIPENKTSVWVHNVSASIQKTPAAFWSTGTHLLDKTTLKSKRDIPVEVWTFYEDDPIGVDAGVLRNNPQQGIWGYTSDIQLKIHTVRPLKSQLPLKPHQIIIVPPGEEAPPDVQVAGVWVRPQLKRDMSALADGTTGFLQVSGQLERQEKHSIGGAWKMLGFNDQVKTGQRKQAAKLPAKEKPKTSKESVAPKKTKEFTTPSPPSKNNDPTTFAVRDPKDPRGKRTFKFDVPKEATLPTLIKPVAQKLNRNPRKFQLVGEDDELPLTEANPIRTTQVYKVVDWKPEEITVKVPSKSRTFTLLVDPDETPQQLLDKARIQACVDPTKPFRLDPVSPNKTRGKRAFVLVPDNTIDDNSNPNHEHLPLGRPKNLDWDDESVEEAPLDKSRTGMELPPIVTLELPDGQRTSVTILPQHNLNDLQDELEEITEIPPHAQRLVWLDPDDSSIRVTEENLHPTSLQNLPVMKLSEVPHVQIHNPTKSRTYTLFIDPEPPAPSMMAQRPNHSISLLPTQTVDDLHDLIPESPHARVFFFDSHGDVLEDEDAIGKAKLDLGKPLRMEVLPAMEIQTPDKSRIFTLYIDPEPPAPKTLKARPKYSLSLLPTQTPADVNALIGEPRARVFFMDAEGRELEDNEPLSRADMDLDGILRMETLPAVEIVAPKSGRTFTLFIDPEPPSPGTLQRRPKYSLSLLPTQTPADVADAMGEPGGTRVFFMDPEGNSLDDDDPLHRADLDLHKPLRLQYEDDPIPITVQQFNGRSFVLMIDRDDTVKDVRQKLRKKSNMQVGGLRLGDLDFDDLEEDELMSNYVRPGMILDAEPPKVDIHVPGVGQRIRMAILPTTTMQDVQDFVEEELYKGKQRKPRVFLMDLDESFDVNTPILKKLNLDKGCQLEVRDFDLQIQHWEEGKQNLTLQVQTTDYIGDVQEMIARSKWKLPVDQQHLTVAGSGKPVDESSSLQVQGIGPSTILKLEQMKIYLQPPMGKKLGVLVNLDDKILGLKKKASKKIKIPVDVLCFMSASTEYFSAQTLRECGVHHKDIIDLETFRIQVMDMYGNQTTMENLKPSDTIQTLKKKVAAHCDVPKSKQILKVESKIVSDKDTASLMEQGIRNRSVLTLVDSTKVDLSLPESEQRRLKLLKTKMFKSKVEDIWPVVPDWKKRIFFFDNDESVVGLVDLTVMHWTGKDFTVTQVKLGWKLKELKERIFKVKHTPIKKQTLLFNGKKLDSKRTLRQQGVLHKSIIVMEGKRNTRLGVPDTEKLSFMDSLGNLPTFLATSIDLKIQHWLGYEFEIEAQPTDYLDDVKDMILEQKKIPVEQQRITYKGRFVDETQGLCDQGIKNGCVLQLEPMEISVEMVSSGKEIPLVVEIDDTIRNVKEQIYEVTRTPLELQCIMVGGVELHDSKTLAECQIDHQDVLHVEEFSLSIMHWSGDVFRLSGIRPDSTIQQVQAEILRVRHVPIKKQRLKHQGKVLQRSKRLEDESIAHKSVLILEEATEAVTREEPKRKYNFMARLETTTAFAPVMKVTIEQPTTGKRFEVGADPKEYLDDLREKIQSDHHIALSDQHLSFQGTPVRDEVSLGNQGIESGSVLTLDPMRLYVETPEGIAMGKKKKYSLQVEPDWTIRSVKQDLSAKTKGALDDFCLMLGPEELEDGKTLHEYGIHHEDILTLEVFKLSIVDASGEAPVEIPKIHRKSTIVMVKRSIAQIKSIPRERQRLSFQGRELNDKKTLVDEGIKHKSILVMEVTEAVFDGSPIKTKFHLSVDRRLASSSMMKNPIANGDDDSSTGSSARLDAVLAKFRTVDSDEEESSSDEDKSPATKPSNSKRNKTNGTSSVHSTPKSKTKAKTKSKSMDLSSPSVSSTGSSKPKKKKLNKSKSMDLTSPGGMKKTSVKRRGTKAGVLRAQ